MKNTNQRQNHGEKVSHLRSAPNKGSGQETVLRSFGKQSEKGGLIASSSSLKDVNSYRHQWTMYGKLWQLTLKATVCQASSECSD